MAVVNEQLVDFLATRARRVVARMRIFFFQLSNDRHSVVYTDSAGSVIIVFRAIFVFAENWKVIYLFHVSTVCAGFHFIEGQC